MAEVFGRRPRCSEPVAGGVEDLDQHVRADGERDAGVEEVARVDHDGRAAAAGLEGAQGGEQVVDRAVALEQMHVLDSAEAALERGGHDDDGDLGAALAQLGGDFGAELTRRRGGSRARRCRSGRAAALASSMVVAVTEA
jgi:hypothetical protein